MHARPPQDYGFEGKNSARTDVTGTGTGAGTGPGTGMGGKHA